MQGSFAVVAAMTGLVMLTQAAVLRTSKVSDAPVAAPANSPAAVSTPRPVGVGDPKAFADLLPFHPAGQPEAMFKNRCKDFLNHVLEKSNYEAAGVEKLMPKCKWTAPECEALKADLTGRLSALPPPIAGTGAAPVAAAPAAAKLLQQTAAPAAGGASAGPAGADGKAALYGWCDTMFEMTHKRAVAELKNATAPAGAPAAAPVVAA